MLTRRLRWRQVGGLWYAVLPSDCVPTPIVIRNDGTRPMLVLSRGGFVAHRIFPGQKACASFTRRGWEVRDV